MHVWSSYNYEVANACDQVGPEFCLRVTYESLFANGQEVRRRVLTFLNIKEYEFLNTNSSSPDLPPLVDPVVARKECMDNLLGYSQEVIARSHFEKALTKFGYDVNDNLSNEVASDAYALKRVEGLLKHIENLSTASVPLC